jgi:hypothetical protein
MKAYHDFGPSMIWSNRSACPSPSSPPRFRSQQPFAEPLLQTRRCIIYWLEVRYVFNWKIRSFRSSMVCNTELLFLWFPLLVQSRFFGQRFICAILMSSRFAWTLASVWGSMEVDAIWIVIGWQWLGAVVVNAVRIEDNLCF